MPVQAISHARMRPSGGPLRFGFTVDRVERIVRYVVRTERAAAADPGDRYEAAWFAVVERLYAPGLEPATVSDLFNAARNGLRGLSADLMHTRGVDRDRTGGVGFGSAPRFAAYWAGRTSGDVEPGFVSAIVERTALRQVLALLTAEQRAALLSLALHQDYERAAAALGMSLKGFHSRVLRAREAFMTWWLEHETPVRGNQTRRRNVDKRVWLRTIPARVAAVLAEEHVPAVLLPDAREVFARLGVDQLASAELLAHLAAVRPQVYGGWDRRDLAAALQFCGVPPAENLRVGGEARRGYRLRSIPDDAVAAPELGPDECELILRAWLEQEAPSDPKPNIHHDVAQAVTHAGPAGMTTGAVIKLLADRWRDDSVRHALCRATDNGTLTRIAPGRYAAAPAALAEAI